MFKLPFYIDWEQALSFWVACLAPVFGLSWFVGCCCSSSSQEPCDNCEPGTTPEDVQVEFDGIVNRTPSSVCVSDGSCTDLNSITFITTNRPAAGPCIFIQDIVKCTDSGGAFLDFIAVQFFAGTVQVTVHRLGIDTATEGLGQDPNPDVADDIDCSLSRTMDMTNVGNAGPRLCDYSSATSDIVPIAAD